MWHLVTLGEVLLRLAIPSPGRFENARTLDVQVGGAEANVAAAVARLGLGRPGFPRYLPTPGESEYVENWRATASTAPMCA
jgi:hypothetical protein